MRTRATQEPATETETERTTSVKTLRDQKEIQPIKKIKMVRKDINTQKRVHNNTTVLLLQIIMVR